MSISHHLAYAGVLLVFFTGAAIVTLTAFLFACVGIITAAVLRFSDRGPGGPPTGISSPALKEPVYLSVEEALAQVNSGDELRRKAIGTAPRSVPCSVKAAGRSLHQHWRKQKTAA